MGGSDLNHISPLYLSLEIRDRKSEIGSMRRTCDLKMERDIWQG